MPSDTLPFPEVLDSSMIATWRSCRHKFFLEYLHHWKSKTPSVHLHAGAAYARGLEVARKAFYQEGKSEEDSHALGLAALMAAYGDFECPADSAKSLERTAGALEYYFEQYPLPTDPAAPHILPSGARAIEFSFAEPLSLTHPVTGNPLIYCGRFDEVVDFAGAIYGLDDKTTSQLGASWPRQWDLRCFSADHELYTRNGWVNISKVTPRTEILQSDSNGNFSFAAPIEVIQKEIVDEALVAIEGRRLSQLITKNHRVLLNKRRGGTITVFAESLNKQDGKHAIPLAGRHLEERLPDDVQRFIVAVQADAKLQRSGGKVTSGRGHREHMPNRAIVFGFSKERKGRRLADLLVRLGVKATEHTRGDTKEFYISGFEDITQIVDSVLDEHKNLRAGYETLFSDAFLDELEFWDGWRDQYYTNSEENARFVSTVAALNDRAASVFCDTEGHWTVCLSEDVQRTLTSVSIKETPYTGLVYCVTVPEGYVLTRRNGHISISGNSQFTAYCWGAKRAGIDLAGFLVRGVSILKTKYDTLQAITYRHPWMIDEWLSGVYCDIQDMIADWQGATKVPFRKDLSESCNAYGGCPFRQVCMSADPAPWLEANFERRKWDPISREETKL